MSLSLKKLVAAINVENDSYFQDKDRVSANAIFERNNLQTVLQTISEFQNDDKLQPGYDKYVTVTRSLIHNAPDTWIRDFTNGFNDSSTTAICVASLKSLSRIAEVSPFTGEEREFIADDFKDVSYRGYLVLACLQTLFKRLTDCPAKDETYKCAANVTYFCVSAVALHHGADLWTSSNTNSLSQSLLSELLTYWNITSISELLVLDVHHSSNGGQANRKTSILGKLLLVWKPNLLRQTWKFNPTIASSFSWCLKSLKYPHTSEFLELILPPSLLFVDDHMSTNKEMGVICLINIMETAGAEELRWYGRADVIYEALKLQMYRTEETLLRINMKALLLVLKVVEKNPDEISTRTRHDEVFLVMLQNASHENKLSLRRVHTEHLSSFIENLGINSVKYLKSIIDLTEEYMEIADAPEELARINILNALNTVIKVAWPRIQAYMIRIVKILIKFLLQFDSDSSSVDSTVKEHLISLVVESLSLLKAIDKDVIINCLSALKELPFEKGCLQVIQKLVQTDSSS